MEILTRQIRRIWGYIGRFWENLWIVDQLSHIFDSLNHTVEYTIFAIFLTGFEFGNSMYRVETGFSGERGCVVLN